MKQFLSSALLSLTFAGTLLAAPVGKEAQWQALTVNGAEGTIQQDESGYWTVTKTKHDGFLTARCSERPAVIPGHFYRISLEFQSDAATLPGYLQLITLPQKRTPYPASKYIYPIGQPRKAVCYLQAGANETSLIINLVTKGHGKATIFGADVTEITEQEYQAATAASQAK